MTSARIRRPHIILSLMTLFWAPALSAATAPARLAEVAEQFRNARYQGSRQSMDGLLPSNAEPGLVRLWQQRLATDPDLAEDLALQIVRDRSAPLEWRLQAALDGASLALARQRSEAAWNLLQPLLEMQAGSLPGDVHLLAGQILRFAGDSHRAREMLASVRPEDPAFPAARSLLGRLGLESGEHELALRYFESAARRLEPGQYLDLDTGAWQALRLLGRDIEARDLADRILREHPTSLAALELRELQRREELETAIPGDLDHIAQHDEVKQPQESGFFTIQLAAFHDRALALQFIARWRAEITGLRIVRVEDGLGQPLHRIQVGHFMSRVQASTELIRMQRQHGIDGFIAERVE